MRDEIVTAPHVDGRVCAACVPVLPDFVVLQCGGDTALMRAAAAGHLEVVVELARLGADVNAKTDDGETALMVAAAAGHLEMVVELARLGADVNAKGFTYGGVTALIGAVAAGHVEVVVELAWLGAAIVGRDQQGRSVASMFESMCRRPFSELQAVSERGRRFRARLPLLCWRMAMSEQLTAGP